MTLYNHYNFLAFVVVLFFNFLATSYFLLFDNLLPFAFALLSCFFYTAFDNPLFFAFVHQSYYYTFYAHF